MLSRNALRKFAVFLFVFLFLGSSFGFSTLVSAPSQVPSSAVLGRYVLWNDKFWMVTNKTVQQLSSEGYTVAGEPGQLVNVNYTFLGFTFKSEIIGITWPNVTVQLSTGPYDLNITVREILDNGTIGGRIKSFLQANQPGQVARTYDALAPSFGPGFDPAVLYNGNTFASWLDYHVTGPETLLGTPWGQNQTFLLTGERINSTQSVKNRVWCDAQTGLILKQIVDTRATNFASHEEQFINQTGIEEIKQGLSDLLPIIIASVIIVIAAIGILIYFLKFRRKTPQQKQVTS